MCLSAWSVHGLCNCLTACLSSYLNIFLQHHCPHYLYVQLICTTARDVTQARFTVDKRLCTLLSFPTVILRSFPIEYQQPCACSVSDLSWDSHNDQTKVIPKADSYTKLEPLVQASALPSNYLVTPQSCETQRLSLHSTLQLAEHESNSRSEVWWSCWYIHLTSTFGTKNNCEIQGQSQLTSWQVSGLPSRAVRRESTLPNSFLGGK